jgi:hypothetical protein
VHWRTGPPHSQSTPSHRPPHTVPTHTWRREGWPPSTRLGTRTPRRSRHCTSPPPSPSYRRTCLLTHKPSTHSSQPHPTPSRTHHTHNTEAVMPHCKLPARFIRSTSGTAPSQHASPHNTHVYTPTQTAITALGSRTTTCKLACTGTCRAVDAHTGAHQAVPAHRTNVAGRVGHRRCSGARIPRRTVATACRHRQALRAAELARRAVHTAAGGRRRRVPAHGTQRARPCPCNSTKNNTSEK